MKVFDLPSLESKIAELHKITENPDFWTSEEAKKVSRDLARLQSQTDKVSAIQHEFNELETMAELLGETSDDELSSEFYERSAALRKNMEEYQILILLNGEYDAGDAIMSIHAGAGGLDSQDWAEMLYRMYTRWAEAHKYTIKLIDEPAGPGSRNQERNNFYYRRLRIRLFEG